MEKRKYSKIKGFLKIFRVKYKSAQFPKHGMTEFPYYGTSIGKHRQFADSAVPNRFRASRNICNHQCLGMYNFP